MAYVAESTSAEASTAAKTRLCLKAFQECVQLLQAGDKAHVQTKLADLRLWADSVGAVAQAKASLDWRYQHRPSDIKFIQGLLILLHDLLTECSTAAKSNSDVRDAITNIDSVVDSLAFTGVQIRRSGRQSRLRKADDSYEKNRDKYYKLRAHLACSITSKPTKEGRPHNEGTMVHSVDYFTKLKLQPIQERLVEANLRRRHRFMEAQRHSYGLMGYDAHVPHTVIPQQYVTMAANHIKHEVSPMQNTKVAAALREKQAYQTDHARDAHTMAATSASGLDSRWGGLRSNRVPRSTVTRITAITASTRYPRANKLSNKEQAMVKCPCCCQAIPTSELEDSQWRKHVANDLCPYTCILEHCPTPYKLFVTQKEWNDHAMNDHPSQWQCPCCEGDPPVFQSLSGITTHMMSDHLDVFADGLEGLLSAAEIHVMGITKCPLCDSEGPQDSPELVEHVFQHIHSFSLYSLPWPRDPYASADGPVGTFDIKHAIKITKDDKGNEHVFHVDEWAESVVPTLDPERGVMFVYNDEGKERILDFAEQRKNAASENRVSLQLCNTDLNPPKLSSDVSEAMDNPVSDYFSHNDYFKDESSDGRFVSLTSQSSRSSQTIPVEDRLMSKKAPQNWICTLCGLRNIDRADVFLQHLDDEHRDEAERFADRDVDQWKQSMQVDAYWNGFEAIETTASPPEFDADQSPEPSQTSRMSQINLFGTSSGDMALIDRTYKAGIEGMKARQNPSMTRVVHTRVVKDSNKANSDSYHDRNKDFTEAGDSDSITQGSSVFDHQAEAPEIRLDLVDDHTPSETTYTVQNFGKQNTSNLEIEVDAAYQAIFSGPFLQRSLATVDDLANKLLHVYERTEDAKYLKQAIYCVQEAINVSNYDDPDLVGRLEQLGFLLDLRYTITGDLSDREEAIQVQQHAIKMMSDDHPRLVKMLNHTAYDLTFQFRSTRGGSYLEEAVVLLQRAVKVSQGKFDQKNNPDALQTMVILASVYTEQHRPEEAEEHLVQVVEIKKEVLGEEHHDTLSTMETLALAYERHGRLQKAEELQLEVIKTTEKVLGKEHPGTIYSVECLASMYKRQGRLDDAEKLQLEVVKTKGIMLGKIHPETIYSMERLASMYKEQGRLYDAEKLQLEVVKTREEVLGKEHWDTIRGMEHLAEMYKERENSKQFLDELTTELESLKRKRELEVRKRRSAAL